MEKTKKVHRLKCLGTRKDKIGRREVTSIDMVMKLKLNNICSVCFHFVYFFIFLFENLKKKDIQKPSMASLLSSCIFRFFNS